MKPSNHTNYYGLVFGGNALDGPSQTYTYFVVAQNGQFLIKQRNGEQTTDVQRRHRRTPRSRRRTARATPSTRSKCAWRATRSRTSSTARSSTPRRRAAAKTDGIVGFRVNHVLEVMVDGFEVQKG